MQERIFAVAHLADQGVLWLLIALCVLALYLIIERYLVINAWVKSSKIAKLKIQKALVSGPNSQDFVLREIAENSESVEGRAAQIAIQHIVKHGEVGLEEIFNSFISIEKAKMEKSLPFLATVGSNAPYIGLFGTVLGIMKSFQDMAQAQSGGGQGAVMAGISGALIATAAGLLVAIPAVLAYNFFSKQVKSIIAGIETIKEIALLHAKLNTVSNRRAE